MFNDSPNTVKIYHDKSLGKFFVIAPRCGIEDESSTWHNNRMEAELAARELATQADNRILVNSQPVEIEVK